MSSSTSSGAQPRRQAAPPRAPERLPRSGHAGHGSSSSSEIVRPDLLVALGATAAQAIIGRDFRITERRGELVAVESGPPVIATFHPSAILRARTPEDRERMHAALVGDLSLAAKHLERSA